MVVVVVFKKDLSEFECNKLETLAFSGKHDAEQDTKTPNSKGTVVFGILQASYY